MSSTKLVKQFRKLAASLEGIDRDVYHQCNQDPLAPIIGHGNADSPIAIFGRDPGRDEVKYQMPFIGAGGQKVRTTLYKYLHKQEMPDFDASVEVGSHFFWANTCPYKPVANKAWSMKVKKQFQPVVSDLLLQLWHGTEIITLGREAFFWFAINQDKKVKQQLEDFWAHEDRFSTSTTVTLHGQDGLSRKVRLHPLPHPSPLNAAWYKRFPELLAQRLKQLKVTL